MNGGCPARLEKYLRHVLAALGDTRQGDGDETRGTAPAVAVLGLADAALVLQALADAEEARTRRLAGDCADCAVHPSGACDRCLDDLETAQAYRELAERIIEEADW